MALQGSGTITISQIRAELVNRNSSYSLSSLAGTAGDGAPYSMSEFYGYSDTFTVTFSMVGGGGGGGFNGGGGGGGGGYLGDTNVTVRRGTGYTATIGGGGGGADLWGKGAGGTGGQTSIFGSTVNGGGGGSGRTDSNVNDQCAGKADGGSGGSGGGALGQGCGASSAGSGTSGQGYPGYPADHYRGHGGGGASGTGGWVGNSGYSEPGHTSTWDSPSNANRTYGGPGIYNGTFGITFGSGGGGGNWQENTSVRSFTQTGGGSGGGGDHTPDGGSGGYGGGGGGGGSALQWGSWNNIASPWGPGAAGGSGAVRLRYPAPQKFSAGSAWASGGYIYHEITGTTSFTTYQR